MESPSVIHIPAGDHYICMCGQSKNLPYCDGSHQGTPHSPRHVTMPTAGQVAICSCQKSASPPFCDGSHKA